MIGLRQLIEKYDFYNVGTLVTYKCAIGDLDIPTSYATLTSNIDSGSSCSITSPDADIDGISSRLEQTITVTGTVDGIDGVPVEFNTSSMTSHYGATSNSIVINGEGVTQDSAATMDVTDFVLDFNDRTIDGVLHHDIYLVPQMGLIALRLTSVTYDSVLYNAVRVSMNLAPVNQTIIMTVKIP